MQSSEPSTEQLLEQASEWLVKMTDDQCTEQDRQAFEYWKQQSPNHQAAAQRIQQMIERLQQLQDPHQHSASRNIIENALLEQPKFHFKPDIQTFIVACITLLAATIAWYQLPIQYWTAHSKNKYDIWQQETLVDQSDIKMSGHSAYDLHFDQHQRIVELFSGNILVDVAKDAKRPFIVETKYASIKALGTRFVVHQTDNFTILTMIESKVEVKSKLGTEIISAGQQAVIDKNGLISIKHSSARLAESAWDKQSLAVEEMPLDQVLDILDSYQQGKLYYNKTDLKQLKVTAILPLNEQNQAFYLLQDSLPIQVQQPIPYLMIIHKK